MRFKHWTSHSLCAQ